MDTLHTTFHPIVASWFTARLGEPTDVQRQAWPAIASGRHVLATAPTGSGKTLAAFLWGLNQLIAGAWPCGRVQMLYVSPLKALNNDVRGNLLAPLDELRAAFGAASLTFPPIAVETRSGDTPSSARQRMLRHPPEILITTPESLNLLLSSPRGQYLLEDVKSVILDEIHAVASAKRGTHLMTAVERLSLLAGEFQRIALSATVQPLEAMAEFVGGYQLQMGEADPIYRKRPVTVIEAPRTKALSVQIRSPHAQPGLRTGPSAWHAVAAAVAERVKANRSTLVFTNSRRVCENITMLLNEHEDRTVAYSHHGSLSREVRTVVEQRLKAGELDAIVATNSLELGIDIGTLDEVVLVETPPTVAGTLQRIGRAGHQVGAESRGTLFPVHPRDVLDAVVMAEAVKEQAIEPLHPVEAPLDVLAQVIASMCAVRDWNPGRLFDFLRTCAPYQSLSRRAFDAVIEMLAGRYHDRRLRALEPLLDFDRIDNVLRARPRARRLVYLSGGTIPDRGYFTLRHEETGARIGELDEEFVWESRKGDVFALGTQSWQVRRITHSDVLVRPAPRGSAAVPFWKAEQRHRSHHLSLRLAEFLEWADMHAQGDAFVEELTARCALDADAAEMLAGFLARQKSATGVPLPHRHHLLVESVSDLTSPTAATQVILHTLWGGTVNHPFAMALSQAWEERTGHRLGVFADDDSIALMGESALDADTLIGLVPPDALESLLRRKLETTGFFGARFRESASIGLQLPRRSYGERMPLWLTRLRAKKLLDSVKRYDDFPLLLETWRACLRDGFELDALRMRLDELRSGAVRISEIHGKTPSPFAAAVVWQQTNVFMYGDDTPETGPSHLSQDLIAEVAGSSFLRPHLPEELIRTFEAKVQRTYPGYAPESEGELLEWLKERLLLSEPEWEELLEALERDTGRSRNDFLPALGSKVARFRFGGSANFHVAAVESIPRMLRAFGMDAAEVTVVPLTHHAPPALEVAARGIAWHNADPDVDPLASWLGEWLRFYGPLNIPSLLDHLPLDEAHLDDALNMLEESETVVVDQFRADRPEAEICDRENLEILLRMLRAQSRVEVTARPIAELPQFLARHQGIAGSASGTDALERALDALFCYPLPAGLVERAILPARVADYEPALLDRLMHETKLLWFGCGRERICFGFPDLLDLCKLSSAQSAMERDTKEAGVEHLFPDPDARYSFSDLVAHSNLTGAALSTLLWQYVWQSAITNDGFSALRKALETGFQPIESGTPRAHSRRPSFSRWRASLPFAGNWRRLPASVPPLDALDAEERDKDRARLLLTRYGIIFRELLQGELPAFRWQHVFRALRLMELSGEVVSGMFFAGVPGPQFALPEAVRRLEQPPPEGLVYWMCAADPASACGLDLAGLKERLPRRVATTYLVYDGSTPVLIAQRNGRVLTFCCATDAPRTAAYLDALHAILRNSSGTASCITVDTVNDEPARESPYLVPLRTRFEVVVNPRNVSLYRKT